MKGADRVSRKDLIGPAITDVAGEPAGRVQIERLVERYYWAASYCEGKVALEVACGTGQGLGLLQSRARKVFGCDLSIENLHRARSTYGVAATLSQADAQTTPFASGSLDIVILLETLYFLPSADAFLSEAWRVLKPGGRLLISSINRDCPDFNPNHPLYFAHYGAKDLSEKLSSHGFGVECFGIIPMDRPSTRARAFAPLKQIAVRLNLIPDSMQARKLLKRIAFGRLEPMPRDISGWPPPQRQPVPLSTGHPDPVHQVILCAGRRA